MASNVCARRALSIAIFAASLAAFMPVANATVKPGDEIQPANSRLIKDIVSPGVYYMVNHGMSISVIAPERVEWPPPYREATEKYAQQVRLSDDSRTMLGYVAGQPFPLIDPNDPHVATKIVWNNVFRPITSDDYDLRFYECQSQYVKPGEEQRIIDDIEVGHYAGYNLVGRTEVDPYPVDPDFNNSNRLWVFALYPVLSPEAERGTGLIRYRYADSKRADDSWDWTPGTRRVRRLDDTILSSATGTQSWDPDHYSGFNPKTEQYDYKFIGDRGMLACVHAEHSPEMTCPYDGGASACPEQWEMRHTYIVQATPRKTFGGARGALDKYTMIYLDAEVWFEPYIDTYDQGGRLWRTHIYYLTYRDRPVPDARVAIYPFRREFVVGAASIDTQGNFSTMCYLPGQHTPERECWYINMGVINKEFCTVKSMVAAAP